MLDWIIFWGIIALECIGIIWAVLTNSWAERGTIRGLTAMIVLLVFIPVIIIALFEQERRVLALIVLALFLACSQAGRIRNLISRIQA